MSALPDIFCFPRLSAALTPEELILSSKANVASTKVALLKKGLAREKNVIASQKKYLTAQTIQPPTELLQFLNSDDTFEVVLKAAEKKQTGHPCSKVC